MKFIVVFSISLSVLFACNKSEDSKFAPKVELISVQSLYAGYDTLTLPATEQEYTVDSSGLMEAIFQIKTSNKIRQISATETGQTTNFTTEGFTETAPESMEFIKLSGFKKQDQDLIVLQIEADSLQSSTITFQVFDENQLSSSSSYTFKITADSTLFK